MCVCVCVVFFRLTSVQFLSNTKVIVGNVSDITDEHVVVRGEMEVPYDYLGKLPYDAPCTFTCRYTCPHPRKVREKGAVLVSLDAPLGLM